MPADCLSPRPLGTSGIDVSGLSLGSWRTYERLPAHAGVEVMRAARQEGINFFDDARYNDETGQAPMPTGYSEVVFGDLFRRAGLRRDEVVVANKLWWEFWPEQDAAAEIEGSLGRMGFEYVDLIYASAPPDGMSVADLVGAVGGLLTSGLARAWGFLNWPADLMDQAARAAASLSVAPPCAAQLPYSLTRRSPVEDPATTQALRAARAGVVASFCLEGGILSGKYRSGPAAGRAAGMLGETRAGPAIAAADDLADLAARLHTSMAALALAFPLANPAVASVLFGATSPEQVRANCAAASLLDRLDAGDLAELARIGRPAGNEAS
ncbi:MAG TPA: aldo/keto reductase [Streptosporangiaceae bacterium]|nr:aldo/keto reductase [Streptosporangiaceae bacterium]